MGVHPADTLQGLEILLEMAMLTPEILIAILNLGTGPAPDNNCALCVNGPGT